MSSKLKKEDKKVLKTKFKRLCPLCPNPTMEDEEHFIFHCNSYNHLRVMNNIEHTQLQNLFLDTFITNLAKYVIAALEHRDQVIRPA